MKKTMEILISRREYDELTFIDMLQMFMMWADITPVEYNELRLQLKNEYHPVVEPPMEDVIPQ